MLFNYAQNVIAASLANFESLNNTAVGLSLVDLPTYCYFMFLWCWRLQSIYREDVLVIFDGKNED